MTNAKVDPNKITPVSEIIIDPDNIVAFDQAEAKLVNLETQTKALVFDYTTKQGLKDVQATVTALTSHKTSIEKRRTAAKKPSLDYGRNLDAYAKKLTARVVALITPLQEKLDAVKKKEELRVKGHRDTLEVLLNIRNQPWEITSGGLQLTIDALESINLDGMEEFEKEARERYLESLTDLTRQLEAKKNSEAQQKELEDARKELADARDVATKVPVDDGDDEEVKPVFEVSTEVDKMDNLPDLGPIRRYQKGSGVVYSMDNEPVPDSQCHTFEVDQDVFTALKPIEGIKIGEGSIYEKVPHQKGECVDTIIEIADAIMEVALITKNDAESIAMAISLGNIPFVSVVYTGESHASSNEG